MQLGENSSTVTTNLVAQAAVTEEEKAFMDSVF